MIGFVTGSDGSGTLQDGLGDLSDTHAGIVFKGGLARIAISPPPELTEPMEAVEDWNDACGLLGFVMYALDREDWMAEFIAYEQLIRDSILDAVDKERIQETKASFKVIQGGKVSEDSADEGE